MSGVPLETCWAFKKLWNNKFYYKAASCWYFYWASSYIYLLIRGWKNRAVRGSEYSPCSTKLYNEQWKTCRTAMYNWHYLKVRGKKRHLPPIIQLVFEWVRVTESEWVWQWCGGRTRREASSFPYVGLVFYLFSCVESGLCVLFWETLMYII